METSTYVKTTTVLTLTGTLFAGYLAGVKLFSGTCAFNESCPYFLGYPACMYGFVLFFAMFIVSLVALFKGTFGPMAAKINMVVSFLGTLFAGYFSGVEINAWMNNADLKYALFLPTCVYGLIFFIVIFVLSLLTSFKAPEAPQMPM